MTGLRYIMEFDGRIVASTMDLGTALILAESFAEKFHSDMERGAKIILYCDEMNNKTNLNIAQIGTVESQYKCYNNRRRKYDEKESV